MENVNRTQTNCSWLHSFEKQKKTHTQYGSIRVNGNFNQGPVFFTLKAIKKLFNPNHIIYVYCFFERWFKRWW